jgi:hypothetical protein
VVVSKSTKIYKEIHCSAGNIAKFELGNVISMPWWGRREGVREGRSEGVGAGFPRPERREKSKIQNPKSKIIPCGGVYNI